jgi:hypothetical protein
MEDTAFVVLDEIGTVFVFFKDGENDFDRYQVAEEGQLMEVLQKYQSSKTVEDFKRLFKTDVKLGEYDFPEHDEDYNLVYETPIQEGEILTRYHDNSRGVKARGILRWKKLFE